MVFGEVYSLPLEGQCRKELGQGKMLGAQSCRGVVSKKGNDCLICASQEREREGEKKEKTEKKVKKEEERICDTHHLGKLASIP